MQLGSSTFPSSHSKCLLLIYRVLWESSPEIWKTRPLICFCLFEVCWWWVTHCHLPMLCWVSQSLLLPYLQLLHILSLGLHSACVSHKFQRVPPKHSRSLSCLQPLAVLQSPPSISYPLPFTWMCVHTCACVCAYRPLGPFTEFRCSKAKLF